jgi:hypothetical protein
MIADPCEPSLGVGKRRWFERPMRRTECDRADAATRVRILRDFSGIARAGQGERLRSRRRKIPSIVVAVLAAALALASLGCGGKGEDGGACAWLFAPPSFVDAGEPACTFEPAGQVCYASSGRCQSVCQPTEFLLTCQETEISRISIAERAFQDATKSLSPPDNCSPVQVPLEAARWQTAYCCPCERRP